MTNDLLTFVRQDLPAFARGVLRSRLGLLMFLAHLALVSCAFAASPGRAWPFEGAGDSLVAQFLFVLNLPMLVATFLLTSPVLYERRPEEFGVLQWAAASFVLFCVLFQWWLYGYAVERVRARRRGAAPGSPP